MARAGRECLNPSEPDRMPLTVLNVSYPLAPVSPATAGGAEQVLSTLDQALVQAGHRSLVLASEGSRCSGLLIPAANPGASLDESTVRAVRSQYGAILHRVLRRFPVDVVHLHGLDFLDYLPEPDVPVVITLHLPPSWYPPAAFHLARPSTYLVCVSHSQLRECPPDAAIDSVIESGVSLDAFHPGTAKGNYALGLGRICPEKAFHLAMDAANAAGLPFWLAGTVFGYPSHREYFANFIVPRLNNGNRFLGAIGGLRKQSLLAGAKCLLISSLVAETSSLVAMEALACGTPVIALRSGALNEIIEDGHTGFLVDELLHMTSAIGRISEIDPAQCRRRAATRFSAEGMTRKYIELYRSISQRHSTESRPEVLCFA
jgi:glycosyltransferase involved in cell wall biosynthesis